MRWRDLPLPKGVRIMKIKGKKNMKRLVIFDGNSIINRAFYGVRMLTNSEGIYTNAIYGFLNILFKYTDDLTPDYLVVAFDLKAPTFRHKMFEGYKAGRKGMPDELAQQMPILKEILAAMNISMISREGYEADDLIGTVSRMCEEEKIECIVATGDRDSLQLVGEYTTVYLTSTKNGTTQTQIMDTAAVEEKYGASPSAVIDIKGLMGDSSDNIPGVAGIGEKTACKLIADYGSIEGVYKNIENIKGATRTKLESGQESAYLSRTLATIDRNVPIEEKTEDFAVKQANKEELAKLLTKLEFKNIMAKLSLSPGGEAKKTALPELECVIIEEEAKAKECVEEILPAKQMSYYIFGGETSPAALSVRTDSKYYCFIFGGGLLMNYDISSVVKIFKTNTLKITHSLKEDISQIGEICGEVFDTSVAAYINEPTRTDYDIGRLCGFETADEFFGKGKQKISPSAVEPEKLAKYGYKLTEAQVQLYNMHKKLIEERGQSELFYDVEMPLCRVLADMERHGFKVDEKSLKDYGEKLSDAISVTEQAVYTLAGGEFNINSPKQLSEVLFERLGLDPVRKTKTGYSTDSEVLDKLEEKHEIISFIKEYRTLVKLKSTYADGLLQVINKSDGKIHSKFNQTVTATGRISSTEPNLQNIPVRMELGREIRKMFTSTDENYVLLDADYSQIELRVLAHISGDETLTAAFEQGKDIHTITASQVLGIPESEVTPQQRGSAKAVNFGIVYGISDFALAGDLKISRKMAKSYMDSYFERYSGVKKYMDSIVAEAKENGYVTTLLSRRRYIPEIKSQKFTERSFGERVAMNTPVQGSAADIIKIAMVKVYNALKEKKLKSKLILQVHDELIVETHKDEIAIVSEILRDNMENAVKLKVPLVAEVHEGETWYAAKG